MDQKYKSLFRDILIFAIGSLGSKFILFILVPLYTNFMTTEEYGTADLVSTFASLIIPIASLAINRSIIRFGMKRGENAQNVIKTTFTVLLISVGIAFIICSALQYYKPISEWRLYLFVIVTFENFFEAEKTYLKVKDKNKILAVISISDTFVLAVTNILMLSVLHMGIKGYLVAIIVAKAFGCAFGFFACNLLCDLKVGKYNRSLARRMIAFSFPLIFSDISYWVIHSTDKLMIEWMLSASALGLYTVATKIPSLINVFISIFNQAWNISSIKEIESDGDISYYSSTFKHYSFLMFGECILIVMVMKPFINVYVGFDFKEAWSYTPLLMVSAVYYSFTVFISSLYAALHKSKNDMWTSLLCAITNVLINYFAIQRYGVWGAVIGTITSYAVCAITRLLDIRRIINFRIDIVFCINTILILLQSIAISCNWHASFVSFITLALFISLNLKEACFISKKVISLVSKTVRTLSRKKGGNGL